MLEGGGYGFFYHGPISKKIWMYIYIFLSITVWYSKMFGGTKEEK